MCLEVYKGAEASRQYENGFFRQFASNLVSLFNDKNINGILVGFPNVRDNKYLKPDCVLITENRIVIIDFKNWEDVEIYLPKENDFETVNWKTSNNRVIEAGSKENPNPFWQLYRQRNWLNDIVHVNEKRDV
ncbi:MAG: NERD domain-containing protein, partial [Candidatus Nomurabacteria bacterium]|nr:NERD domain-containing protein [Candidatus Nomurabacteria bacterium]